MKYIMTQIASPAKFWNHLQAIRNTTFWTDPQHPSKDPPSTPELPYTYKRRGGLYDIPEVIDVEKNRYNTNLSSCLHSRL